MSAMVCQGLQSCLESGFLEPRAIIDQLAPSRSNHSQSIPWPEKPNMSQEQKDNSWNNHELENSSFDDGKTKKQSNNDGDLCWSFIQELSNTKTTQNGNQISQAEEEKVYVHPLAKRSSSTLSTQSLEMCTESLGSETGSNSDEIMADLSFLSFEIQSREGSIQRSRSRESFTKKLERNGSFPPPLTMISSSEGIQLRPHREGGRLVLKAVTFCHRSCFQAERIDGRLRLFSSSKNGHNNCEEDKQSEELENETADEEQDFILEENTDDYACDEDDDFPEEEDEGIQGSGGVLECEIETEEFPRPSRCKEEGPRNRGLNWESFLVPIS